MDHPEEEDMDGGKVLPIVMTQHGRNSGNHSFLMFCCSCFSGLKNSNTNLIYEFESHFRIDIALIFFYQPCIAHHFDLN